ncbi:Cytochrome P [Parasponia andersonii]|uniref:Cytochrome P n=1 Tax=Parasponia andersonii TaxID=3476 RepID=A0A2P5A9P5_PARAD|nr:Cytochrome P [Parasponia andersonii]
MKNLFETIVYTSVPLLIQYFVFRVIYNIFLKPIYLEKRLRQQGIKGTHYKFNTRGDIEEVRRSTMEAWSKPMSLNHHIAPRVSLFFNNMFPKYGKVCTSWSERRPKLIIGESELIRIILAGKKGHFVKPPLNPLVNILQLGLSTLEGQQWAMLRRLMTPAFHVDKLKGMLPSFLTSCTNLIDRWKKLTSLQGSTEIDVTPEFYILTGDAIARTVFGSSYEEGSKIFELQKEQITLVLEAYNSFYYPGLRFIPTKKNRRRYKLDNEIKEILRDLTQGNSRACKIKKRIY